jgi:hypothetical protein
VPERAYNRVIVKCVEQQTLLLVIERTNNSKPNSTPKILTKRKSNRHWDVVVVPRYSIFLSLKPLQLGLAAMRNLQATLLALCKFSEQPYLQALSTNASACFNHNVMLLAAACRPAGSCCPRSDPIHGQGAATGWTLTWVGGTALDHTLLIHRRAGAGEAVSRHSGALPSPAQSSTIRPAVWPVFERCPQRIDAARHTPAFALHPCLHSAHHCVCRILLLLLPSLPPSERRESSCVLPKPRDQEAVMRLGS